MEIKKLEAFQDYSEEKFTKRDVFQSSGHVVFVLNFLPGQEVPPHKHPGTQVYGLVLEGEGTMRIEGQESGIQKNDLIHVNGDQAFSFKNTSDRPLSIYVTLAKN